MRSKAIKFFGIKQHPAIAESLGKPDPNPPYSPFAVQDLVDHLEADEALKEKVKPQQRFTDIQRLLGDMERGGLLTNTGRDPLSSRLYDTSYWSIGRVAKSQTSGLLWLAEAVGPGLIIETYGAITAPVARPGEPGIGSGLVLDQWHILTNKHVVEDLHICKSDELETPKVSAPSVLKGNWHEPPATMRVAREPLRHDELDVAVIEFEQTDDKPGLNTVGGIVWRDPIATDETSVFGYPPVLPCSTCTCWSMAVR